MKDSQRKAMFAKKSNSFKIGDDVISSIDHRIYKIPKRPVYGERLGVHKVLKIENIKFPEKMHFRKNGETGMIAVTTTHGNGTMTGGLENFTKYHPRTKYKINEKGKAMVYQK